MSSFGREKKTAISNNWAQKTMVTNLISKRIFMAMAKSEKLWWQITILEITSAKLGTSIIIVIDLYYLCKSIDNNQMWIVVTAFLINGNKFLMLCYSNSNSWINFSINKLAQVTTSVYYIASFQTFDKRQRSNSFDVNLDFMMQEHKHHIDQKYSQLINGFFWFQTAC